MVNSPLSSESMTFEVPPAQNAPQRPLRIGHASANLPCVRVWHWCGVAPSSSFG